MDLGCGDSSVQDQMREEGYEILACDISTVVLERLAKKDREMITVDAYNLPFTNSSFDVIFDKGTPLCFNTTLKMLSTHLLILNIY